MPYGGANISPGGNMAIAQTGGTTNNATLWATLAESSSTAGELWGYAIAPGGSPILTNIFNPTIQATNAGNCTGLPTLPATFSPASFAQPTLVNGMVFAPVHRARTSAGATISGGGVMVYGTCN